MPLIQGHRYCQPYSGTSEVHNPESKPPLRSSNGNWKHLFEFQAWLLCELPHLDDLGWCFSVWGLCCCSVSQPRPTLCDPMDCRPPGYSVLHCLPSLLKLMSIELVMPSNHLILCHPLLLPSIFPSMKVFSNDLALCIRWPKYWCFSVSISPSNEYSGLISFKIDWFDLLEVQGTFKSLLQHHGSASAFFMVKLSHPYMAPGKTIAFTVWNFVGKVMSLPLNTLCCAVLC